VSGHGRAAGRRRERGAVAAGEDRAHRPLGHLQDAGHRKWPEARHLVQGGPRDRAGPDVAQVDPPHEPRRDVAERDRPAQEGDSEHRWCGECVSMGEWPR
jgi:hypothetical protein